MGLFAVYLKHLWQYSVQHLFPVPQSIQIQCLQSDTQNAGNWGQQPK